MSLANAINSINQGIQSLTSSASFNGVTISPTANQSSISNGDGISGNPTISLTSTIYTNISFNSGSNTLSIYTTGTYTPAISSSGTQPTVGYSVQLGRYTRIGNRIFGNIVIKVNSYTAGTGNFNFNVPFTAKNVAAYSQSFPVNFENITFGALVLYYISSIQGNQTLTISQGMRSTFASLQFPSTGAGATTNFYTSFRYEI